MGLELVASYPIGGVGNTLVLRLEVGLELHCMTIFDTNIYGQISGYLYGHGIYSKNSKNDLINDTINDTIKMRGDFNGKT